MVFSERAKEKMLSGNPVPKSEQGRTIEKVENEIFAFSKTN